MNASPDLTFAKDTDFKYIACTNALKDRMSEKGHPEHSPLFAIHGTVTLPTWM
ncbi:MAG: hypothetical protein HRT54_21930 [Colwellia sp.]|nr:hypothetical protein [Colwellia sp.]